MNLNKTALKLKKENRTQLREVFDMSRRTSATKLETRFYMENALSDTKANLYEKVERILHTRKYNILYIAAGASLGLVAGVASRWAGTPADYEINPYASGVWFMLLGGIVGYGLSELAEERRQRKR